jgi:hypothetical protein
VPSVDAVFLYATGGILATGRRVGNREVCFVDGGSPVDSITCLVNAQTLRYDEILPFRAFGIVIESLQDITMFRHFQKSHL